MKSNLVYIGINSVFVSATIAGLFYDVTAASNIAYFMAWVTVICCFVVMFGSTDETKAKIREESNIPIKIDTTFDTFITLCFAAAGSYFTAAAYLVQMLLTIDLKTNPKYER